MEQIFRRAPGPNARLATQISWQKPRGSPPPKVSTWPFPVAGGGLPGSLTCLDVIQGADVLPPSWKKPNFEDATYKIL